MPWWGRCRRLIQHTGDVVHLHDPTRRRRRPVRDLRKSAPGGETGLDYEAGATRNVTIRTTDLGGLFIDKIFTISVTDVNEAPTAVTLTNTTTSLAENTDTTNRVKVADIQITDDALGTNTLSVSGADAAAFEIVGTALYVKAGTTLNYEAKSSYTVTVNVDDMFVGATPDATTDFTLSVTNVNEAPTNVTLSSNTVAENAPNAVVGTFTTTDPDAGDTFTYTIRAGGHGMQFAISGISSRWGARDSITRRERPAA